MLSIKEILPLNFNYLHIDYLQKKFKFISENIKLDKYDTIKIIDNEITLYLTKLQGIDLSDTTNEYIQLSKNLMYNLLLVNNLDYINPFNKNVRGIEKWLIMKTKLGSGAEGNVYHVNIIFNNLTSPNYILKHTRSIENNESDLLKEYMNYNIMSLLNDFSPNFINTVGLLICNSSKKLYNSDIILSNSPLLCSCVGNLNCIKKNFLINLPYDGNTIESILKNNNEHIIINNMYSILKQVTYSLKIAQSLLEFTHKDLNLRNVSISILKSTEKLSYKINEKMINIETDIKVNIFDYGASVINKFDWLLQNNIDIAEEYIKLFMSKDENEKLIEILKKIKKLGPNEINDFKNNNKGEWSYMINKSYYIELGMSFSESENEILNDLKNNVDGTIKILWPNLLSKINDVVEHFDSMSDIKIFINYIKESLNDKGYNNFALLFNDINNANSIDDVINLLNKNVSIDDLNLQLKDIKKIEIKTQKIEIDGYKNDLYGDDPKFDYHMIKKSYDFYNTYGSFNNSKCKNDNNELKSIIYGNPGDSIFFRYNNHNIFFKNKKLTELDHPKKNDQIDYTYAFVINKYNNELDVRFGKIINLMEIGAKHTIISQNDDVIVSGELSIRNINDDITYYININSSKMDPAFSSINFFNNTSASNQDTNTFYYILMINLSLKLFMAMNDKIDIKLPNNMRIVYGENFDARKSNGDLLFKYYNQDANICPDNNFIKEYNDFGKDKKIYNACILEEEKNKKLEDYTCDWDKKNINGGNNDEYYKLKYLKYKNKYINLRHYN